MLEKIYIMAKALAEIYFQEYCDILTKNFRSSWKQGLFVDVTFICRNRRKISAHQLVLGSFSPMFYELFEDQTHQKGSMIYVSVPDVSEADMKNILTIIYYGKVTLRNKEELLNFYSNSKLLNLPCTFRSYTEKCSSVMQINLEKEKTAKSMVIDVPLKPKETNIFPEKTSPKICSIGTLDPSVFNNNQLESSRRIETSSGAQKSKLNVLDGQNKEQQIVEDTSITIESLSSEITEKHSNSIKSDSMANCGCENTKNAIKRTNEAHEEYGLITAYTKVLKAYRNLLAVVSSEKSSFSDGEVSDGNFQRKFGTELEVALVDCLVHPEVINVM